MTGSGERGNNPKITEEHRRFNTRVAAISQRMSAWTLDQLVTRFGQPPSEDARRSLRFATHYALDFAHDGKSKHSRFMPIDVAGSDYVVFNSVVLPNEANSQALVAQEDDPTRRLGAFPGRIIDLTMLYGDNPEEAHPWQGILFSGPDTPPLMVDRQALADNDLADISLESLFAAQGRLPASAFYYPDAAGLRDIREGLTAIRPDIDLYSYLDSCRMESYSLYQDTDGDWFRDCANTIRPAYAD